MLSERQLHLLNVIVEDYIDSGIPIGSKALLETHHLNVSPATVRAEMKKLEDFGLIEKVHSSSGRMPSEAGYQFYVESLKEEFPQTIDEFNQDIIDFQSLARKLAQETHYMSIAAGDITVNSEISQIHLTYLTPVNLVLIIVYQNGEVEHQSISWDVKLTRQEIERMNNYLNENLATITRNMALNQEDHVSMRKLPLSYLKRQIQKKTQSQKQILYLEGKQYLYELMDTEHLDAVKTTLHLIDSRALHTIINQMNNESMEVISGKEINETLEGISIVSLPIKHHNVNGRLAVIGPTQMSYRKVFDKLSNIHKLT